MNTVHKIDMDGSTIRDGQSFHLAFKNKLGFPDYYGMNMNAWIDCMGDIYEYQRIAKVVLKKNESLEILIHNGRNFVLANPEFYANIVSALKFVNEERIPKYLKGTGKISIIFAD